MPVVHARRQAQPTISGDTAGSMLRAQAHGAVNLMMHDLPMALGNARPPVGFYRFGVCSDGRWICLLGSLSGRPASAGRHSQHSHRYAAPAMDALPHAIEAFTRLA